MTNQNGSMDEVLHIAGRKAVDKIVVRFAQWGWLKNAVSSDVGQLVMQVVPFGAAFAWDTLEKALPFKHAVAVKLARDMFLHAFGELEQQLSAGHSADQAADHAVASASNLKLAVVMGMLHDVDCPNAQSRPQPQPKKGEQPRQFVHVQTVTVEKAIRLGLPLAPCCNSSVREDLKSHATKPKSDKPVSFMERLGRMELKPEERTTVIAYISTLSTKNHNFVINHIDTDGEMKEFVSLVVAGQMNKSVLKLFKEGNKKFSTEKAAKDILKTGKKLLKKGKNLAVEGDVALTRLITEPSRDSQGNPTSLSPAEWARRYREGTLPERPRRKLRLGDFFL